MRVVFIGVGEALDENEANTSILIESRMNILLDCGYNIPNNLWRYRDDPDFLDAIYISHFHADHCFGIPPLLMRMWEDGRRKKLLIMGQRGIKERVELLMNLGYEGFLDKMNYIKFIEIDNGAELDGISIRTARTEHSLKNLAVRIDVGGKSVCYSGDGKLTSDVIRLFRRSNLAICECYSIKPIVQTHSCLEDLKFDDGPELIALVHINRREREKIKEVVRGENRFIVPNQFDSIDL
jgi:mRNA degradation ribonuclease J1/J2